MDGFQEETLSGDIGLPDSGAASLDGDDLELSMSDALSGLADLDAAQAQADAHLPERSKLDNRFVPAGAWAGVSR